MSHRSRPQGVLCPLCPLSAEDCGIGEEAAAEHHHHHCRDRDSSHRTLTWAGSRFSALKCLNSGGRDGTPRPDEPGGGCSGPGERETHTLSRPETGLGLGQTAVVRMSFATSEFLKKSDVFMELVTRYLLHVNQCCLPVNSAYRLFTQTALCSSKDKLLFNF